MARIQRQYSRFEAALPIELRPVGAIAPLLPIDRRSSPAELPPESFILWTLRALTDSEYRAQIVSRNLKVCQRFFSLDALERQLRELFKDF